MTPEAKIRYYVDEHVARAVISGMRRRGIVVVTVPDRQMLGASDIEHLKLADNEGLVLFSQDDDFLKIHSQAIPHRGIVYAPQHTPVSKIIADLQLIHDALSPDEMRNHIEFLPYEQTRHLRRHPAPRAVSVGR